MFLFISLFFSLVFADCDYNIKLDNRNENESACLEIEKTYTIGHIRFFTFPKARLTSDRWPYDYIFFHSNSDTRNELCRLLGAIKESAKSHISDQSEAGISFENKAFITKKNIYSLKVLACRII